jgi:hypothetical protein
MKQHYPANLTNSSIRSTATIAINAQMPLKISLRIKDILTRATATKTMFNTFLHTAAISFSPNQTTSKGDLC